MVIREKEKKRKKYRQTTTVNVQDKDYVRFWAHGKMKKHSTRK